MTQNPTHDQTSGRRLLALLAVCVVILLGLGSAPAQAVDGDAGGPAGPPSSPLVPPREPAADPPGGPPGGVPPSRPDGPVGLPPDGPTAPGEPPGFGGEPVAPRVAYEVLIVMSEDDHTILRPAAASKLPTKSLPAKGVIARAQALSKAWTSKGYRATVLYAPGNAAEIRGALRRIADRYRVQVTGSAVSGTKLAQIAIHYEGHGGTGAVNTSVGNADHVNIGHAEIGAATAAAFPAGATFDSLDVVAVFDACHQYSALARFTDALLAGRKSGTTRGRTISSTGEGDDAASCKAAVGVFSDGFLAGYPGTKPSLGAVDTAFDMGVAAQRRELAKGAANPPALGTAAMRKFPG